MTIRIGQYAVRLKTSIFATHQLAGKMLHVGSACESGCSDLVAIVERVFEETVEQMVSILMQELMSEDRNNRHAEAERRFQNGLALAVRARDRIKDLVCNTGLVL
jgi:hypothetical protein